MAYVSTLPRLPNRRRYWEDRRGIWRGISTNRDIKGADDDQESIAHVPQINMQHVNAVIAGLRTCTQCGNDDEETFSTFNIDDHCSHVDALTLTQCLQCGFLYGADDSMSPQDVAEWMASLPLQLCGCGNQDSHKYKFCDRDGEIVIRCECCMEEIIVNENKPGHSDQDSDNDGISEQLVCKCGNNKQDTFDIHTADEKAYRIECKSCGEDIDLDSENDFPDVDELLRDYDTCDDAKELPSKPAGKSLRVHARQLQKGDHIAWWRTYAIWHHALVIDTNVKANTVTVIHFGKDLNKKLSIHSAVLEIEKQNGMMYSICYDGPCYSSDKAIAMAMSMIGQMGYNFVTNNCEHFVRWCKTGKRVCKQVWDFAKYISSETGKAVSHGLAKLGVRLSGKAVISLLVKAAIYTADDIANAAAFATNKIANFLGPVAVLAIEVGIYKYKTRKLDKSMKENKLSEPQYKDKLFALRAKTGCRTIGTIAGSVLGSFFIPIPFWGTLIGSTIGGIIGHLVGVGIHRANSAYNERRQKNKEKLE